MVYEPRGWLEWLREETNIPRRTARDYMDVAKESRPGGLFPPGGNFGYTEALIKIRQARPNCSSRAGQACPREARCGGVWRQGQLAAGPGNRGGTAGGAGGVH